LEGDVPKTTDKPRGAEEISASAAAKEATAKADFEHEKARQEKQNTAWRRFLFWGISMLVLVVASVSLTGFLLYVHESGPAANPTVISTWIGGSVVQTVGLLLIITRHLFPQAEGGRR
jgi:polyferredoxin